MHTHELTARRRADVPSRRRGQLQRRRILEHDTRALAAIRDAVDRAKLGDPDGLEEIYIIFAGNVYGYVCSIVRDEHEAEDITQQIFAKLLTALDRYEPRVVPFSAWVLRVAQNAAIDHMRTRRPVPTEELGSAEAPDHASARERFADLRLALDALPAEQRDVIVLRFLIGLSPSEIAVRMGRSEDAVHGLQHRGRRRLRREMLALAA